MGAYLPDAGILGWAVWTRAGIIHSQGVPPNFYLLHMNVGLPVPTLLFNATPCLLTSPPYLHVSAFPTHLDEYGFFKCLVIGFPYSLIFLTILGVVFRFSCTSFLWLCKEVKRVYLPFHFDQKSSKICY
ncbi:hypothetical protein HJG60_008268 [Phyllostomus discolor]|uniref:Uncharacterized protein n=1 Tax=Phyllostomus discolor TaxID=89673 RepID=A0A833Z1I9_9CHIR|nr:hypothetical protein HJG60_008268 [Phyllostomus discolor]